MSRTDKFYSGENKGRHVNIKPAFMITQFLVCIVFWLVLSGHYDTEHIVMGVIASVIVTLLTNDLFYTFFSVRGMGDHSEDESIFYVFKVWLRLIIYAFWLLYQIIVANLHVAYLVLHPKMPIDPKMMAFECGFNRSISLVTLANSITLTPGTITVDLHGDKFIVHAIDVDSAGSLADASMQNRIASVFGEKKTISPKIDWANKINGLR